MRRAPTPQAEARLRRLGAVGRRARGLRLRRPRVEHLGMGQAQELAHHHLRLLAHPLRHRRRRRPALGVRHLAAPPRGRRTETHWSISRLARIPPVRSGLIGMFSQNLILMGIFFVVPLYLQLVLGLSALETGIKMLPDLDHHVRDRGGRGTAVEPLRGARHRPERLGRDTRWARSSCSRRSSPPSRMPDSPSAWPCSASGWA